MDYCLKEKESEEVVWRSVRGKHSKRRHRSKMTTMDYCLKEKESEEVVWRSVRGK
ncbi:hypothetical protein FH972_025772 [Carpinus fangiana]|uniref:Uncharacterized protein n=1 Tax=Carpinus fangiana TaxID=176857 RepID=A0A5N6L2E3_9ROSI|nr:hypothetical protein FH972_025772 [Carpinus fangiana]